MPKDAGVQDSALEDIAIDDATIKKALRNIYDKNVDVSSEIEPELFEATWQKLNLAVDEGFGKVKFGEPNFGFVNELKHNTGVFSAYKVHRQQNDITKLMLDEKGKLKPFSKFARDALPITDHNNKLWLRTEYDTAVLRARQAANFKKFEKDADLYPNLKWLASTSIEKREGHVRFYGLVKPINDPFWDEHFPGNLWNCKCDVTNTDEAADHKIPQADYAPASGLDENPKNGIVFSKSNIYRKKGYLPTKELDRLATGFVEKQMHISVRKQLKGFRKTIDQYNGIDIEAANIITGKIKILRKSIKNVDFYNSDWRVKAHILNFENIKNWEYIGWNSIFEGKHPEAGFFTYYKVKIGNKIRYVNVIGHNSYKTELLYSIFDSIDIKSLKKGYPPNIADYK